MIWGKRTHNNDNKNVETWETYCVAHIKYAWSLRANMCPGNSTEKHSKTVQTLKVVETIKVKHNVSSNTRCRCIIAHIGYNVNESGTLYQMIANHTLISTPGSGLCFYNSGPHPICGCRMCIKFDTILSNVISVRTSKSWFVFVIMKYSMYIICCLWLGCVELCPPMFLCPGAVSYDRTMKHEQWFAVSIDIRSLAHIIPWPWCYDVFTQCSPLYM